MARVKVEMVLLQGPNHTVMGDYQFVTTNRLRDTAPGYRPCWETINLLWHCLENKNKTSHQHVVIE